MVLEENYATHGGVKARGGFSTVDPQRGKQDRGTDAEGDKGDQTGMDVDGQDQQIGP